MLLYIQRLGTGNFYQLTEPLGLKNLAAYVEDKGYWAKVFSGPVHEAVRAVAQEIASLGLDAVGLYCDYENRSVVESFCRQAKEEWGIRIFVGGPQSEALGVDFLQNSGCDALVHREGEYVLHELLEVFVQGRGKLSEVRGVSYLEAGGLVRTTPTRPPIAQLDDLPLRVAGRDVTARDSQEILSLLTGRGCPFKCAFCYEGSVPGKVRLRSVDNVMSEIRQSLAHNPGLKFLWFADDTFTLNRQRVLDFCRELTVLRREHDFVWFCECHPNTMINWPDMLPMMLDAGLVRMQIGIETGSPRVMRMYKKQTTPEQIEQVVEFCLAGGLPQLVGNMIIGGADESRSTFEQTKQFAARLLNLGPGMMEVTSTFFMPFPKTAITEDPAAFGLRLLDPDSLTSKNDVAVTETEELSREELTAMRAEFTRYVHEVMTDLFQKGRIPRQRILRDYRLHQRYGMESGWFQNIYSEDQPTNRYYQLCAAGDIVEAESRDHPWEAYPLRTVQLWRAWEAKGGAGAIGDRELSHLELRLLLWCDGAHTLRQVRDRALAYVAEQGMDAADLDQDFLRAMTDFHQRLWLGYGNEPTDRLEPALNHASGERLFKLDDDDLLSDQSRVRIRLALPVPPMNGEANQGPEIWPALKSTLQDCSRAGIPLVTATLVMPPGTPVDLDYMKPILAWLGELMESMKGGFEVDLEPVFPRAAGGDSNPEAYVPLSRYEDVWEEFPGLDPERVFAAGRGIRGYLTGIMRDILQRGIIPHEVLLKHFELYRGRGLHSVWLDNVFLPDVRVHNYYVMMSRGAVKRLEDIDPNQRDGWRPQRTIDLWGAADFSGGFARIGRHALSPLEYQLLLFSTGKQTLGQVLRAVHQRFADRFQGYDDFAEVALEILRQFETRLWLAYSQL